MKKSIKMNVRYIKRNKMKQSKTKSQEVFTKEEIIMAMKDQEDFFGKEIYSKLREKLGLGKRQ
jgi:hypothetical protein